VLLPRAIDKHAEAIMCAASAYPQIIALLLTPGTFPPALRQIVRAYATEFWRPKYFKEAVAIAVTPFLWPLGVLIAALWFTYRNGMVVAAQGGRSIASQFGDQLRIAATAGLLPAWYYIFELYRPGRLNLARSYLTRGQTKKGVYRLFARAQAPSSPLSDKGAFASYCAERQIPTMRVLVSAIGGELRGRVRSPDELPKIDLFVKPARSCGGRGAERWDYLEDGQYRSVVGETLSAAQLLDRIRTMSRDRPYLIQERARNHPAIADLSNGALNTVRMISCLDEWDRPEPIGAVLRLAVGRNTVVDNVHAGGLHAGVDLESGTLLRATDIGLDARLGWIARHPDTNAPILGRKLPFWEDVLALVWRAHSAFADWLVVGWDVAILADGPRLVEGNCRPDVDLMQRPLGIPFGSGRFGELLAFHIQRVQSLNFQPARPRSSGRAREASTR
jgi:hypothetical protein